MIPLEGESPALREGRLPQTGCRASASTKVAQAFCLEGEEQHKQICTAKWKSGLQLSKTIHGLLQSLHHRPRCHPV